MAYALRGTRAPEKGLPPGTDGPSLRARLGGLLALTKPRIVELLLITTLPAMVLAAKGWPSTWLVVVTIIGGAMAAGGANALNMVIDRDIDAIMARTSKRPLVTGVVSVGEATAFALSLEVAAFVLLATEANLLAALLATGAAAFYVGIYTMVLKRRSPSNIVIGGAAGAAPALVGWAAVKGDIAWSAVMLFGIVILWTPPHFWALAVRFKDDYRAAEVPMLPAVVSLRRTALEMSAYGLATVALSLALVPVGHMGLFYLVAAALLGLVFLGVLGLFWIRRSASVAMAVFHTSIAYLGLLFLAVGLDVAIRL